jgi:hypothetical protein
MFDKIRRAGCGRPAHSRWVTNPPPTAVGENISSPAPPEGEVVLVQCEKFRCLAFRDQQGKWRSPFSKMELHNVVGVIKATSN